MSETTNEMLSALPVPDLKRMALWMATDQSPMAPSGLARVLAHLPGRMSEAEFIELAVDVTVLNPAVRVTIVRPPPEDEFLMDWSNEL